MDEFLKSLGIKYTYEELTKEERATVHEWLSKMESTEITIADIRRYIGNMKDAVENELTKVGNSKEEDFLLKARLRNYMLLSAFLETPDRARAALRRANEGIAK